MTSSSIASLDHSGTGMSGRRRTSRRLSTLVARYNELGLALFGGALLLAGFLVHLGDGPHTLRLLLLGSCAVVTSTRTFPDAIASLRRLRLNVDVLMFVAAGGAASLGHHEEGAFLLFLFGLGSAGEHLAVGRARRAIEALYDLAPETAQVVDDDGTIVERAVESIEPGTTLVIRPFDRIPLDARIIDGNTSIDESMLTGESIPVEKTIDDDIFAGTMNGAGMVRAITTHRAGETTLARIMTLVEQAQEGRSATQRFTDRVEAWYVPFVFAATIVMLLVPPLLFDGAWATWFIRAMAFMTAASPCALAIGTPAAILCGIARSAQLGVLVKGGEYLESLGRLDAVAFDKTGTLTRGAPEVVDVIAVDGLAPMDVVARAAAIERDVVHPLADAIVRYADEHDADVLLARTVTQTPGIGAHAVVDDERIAVIKPSKTDGAVLPASLRDAMDAWTTAARTLVLVTRNDEPIGIIGLADHVRDEARDVVRQLRELGIEKQTLLTGDHVDTAKAVASQVGIDDVHADLSPEDKLHRIDALRERHGGVAMIGDGVNDAPALARATVGIAMGAAGTDAALETADIALMANALHRLPDAIGLSRAARRIIVQNLVIALSVIIVVAPLGALGYADLGLAVLLHEGSTIVVVINALRLLAYRADDSDVHRGDNPPRAAQPA